MARARFDWLVELGGATALGVCGGYAGLKLAPSLALPASAAMTATGFSLFALGFLATRATSGAASAHPLPDFAIVSVESDELLLDEPIPLDELLLDAPIAEPAGDDVLLLDDALPEPDPASRVVQLFAAQPIPTPGQLKERIDRHLAGAGLRPAVEDGRVPHDASAALYAALDQLRRSLR